MVTEVALETCVSLEEYLAMEDSTDEQLEWLEGVVRRREASPYTHNTVSGNIIAELALQLRGKKCQALGCRMRMKIALSGYRYYPDVLIACPPLEWDDELPHTIINPRIVIEVLSPSTEHIDRGEKLNQYTQVSSLTDYLLISTDTMQVTHFHRMNGEDWRFHILRNEADVIDLPEYECHLPLTDIYDRLDLASV